MKRLIFILTLTLTLGYFAHAQTATDLNAGLTASENTDTPGDGDYRVSWFGKQDYAYFLLHSENLDDWVYEPLIFSGNDAVLHGIGFIPDGEDFKGFWKLRYLDGPVVSPDTPNTLDPDGDGIGALDELNQMTDPFRSQDADFDLLPDDWEWFYFASYSLNQYSDYDGDFVLDGQEWEHEFDPSVQDPIPTLSFSPSSSPTYIGSIDISIGSNPYIGYIYYTIDGSAPTAESGRYHPSSPIVSGNNTRLTIKAKIILPDGRQSDSTIEATYKIRPAANPTTVYYGYNKFTGDPVTTTNLNLLAPAINQGFSHGYLILGSGWVENGSFVPDLSQSASSIYYGLATCIVNGAEIPYYGYSTAANSFWATPNPAFLPFYIHAWPRNYQGVGEGWILSDQSINPDLSQTAQQIRVVQNRYYIPYSSGVALYEDRWLLTTDAVGATGALNFIYPVAKGWISSFENMAPDTSLTSSTVYYGVVSGVSGLQTIYTNNFSVFPSQSQDYVSLSAGWPSGLKSMIPDVEQESRLLFYGEKDFVSAAPSERVLALNRLQINPGAGLPTYKDIALGKGWTTSIETYDRDFNEIPQPVYLGTENVGPGVLQHIEFHAYTIQELTNSTNLGNGWIESNYFIPYEDDNDGLSYADEILYGTDPRNSDSDGDGISDGDEVYVTNTDPTKSDSDGDGDGDSVDILPNDPTNGLDDTVPPDMPVIEVDHVTINRNKPGHLPFQPDIPPSNRYLRREYSQTFSQTGSGEGPEGSLSATETSSINPLTGEETTSQTGTTGTRNGSMSATSPTQRAGTSEISSYDDPPNKKNDEAEGDLSSTESLSELYTTQAFVTDTLANQEAWPDTYISRNPVSYYHITDDELSVSYRKIKYRFKWDDISENHQEKSIDWIVLYAPDTDGEALEAESYSWTGEALEHEPIPIVPNKEGTWSVISIEMTPNPIPANGVVRAKLDLSPLFNGLDKLDSMPDASIQFDGEDVTNLRQDEYNNNIFYFDPIADGEDDSKDILLSGFVEAGENHPDVKLKDFARYTSEQAEGVKLFSDAIGVSIEEAKSRTNKKVEVESLTERDAADYFSSLMEAQTPLAIYLMSEHLGDDISDDAADALEDMENTNIDRALDVITGLSFDPDSGSVEGGGLDQVNIDVVALEATLSETGEPIQFRVTRSNGYNVPLTISFVLSGAATNGTDYAQVPLSVTIEPFTAYSDIKIDPIADSIAEGIEDVIIEIQEDPLYSLGQSSSATIEIVD